MCIRTDDILHEQKGETCSLLKWSNMFIGATPGYKTQIYPSCKVWSENTQLDYTHLHEIFKRHLPQSLHI